eukprot:195918_1
MSFEHVVSLILLLQSVFGNRHEEFLNSGWTYLGNLNRFCSAELMYLGKEMCGINGIPVGIPLCYSGTNGKTIQDRIDHNNCVAQSCESRTQMNAPTYYCALDYRLESSDQVAAEGTFPLGTGIATPAACATLCDTNELCYAFDYGSDLSCNGNYNRDPETQNSSVYDHYSIGKTTILAPQPILFYEFNDLTETISGGDPKYTLIPGDDASTNSPTITDGVLSCNGADYLHSQHNLDFYLTDHTIEARVRLDSLGGSQNAAPFSIDGDYLSDLPSATYNLKGFSDRVSKWRAIWRCVYS